jgi:hypothetical protein
MAVDEWAAVVALCLSELVIGSVVLKAADTIILPKMLAVFDVAPAVRVRPLWLTRVILLQWILHRTMAWVQGQWQALQAQVLSRQQLEALDLAVGMGDSTLVVHLAPMLFPLVLVPRQAHIPPSTLTLAQPEALTLPAPSTVELLKQRSSPQATDQHQQAHPTTSIPTKVKAIHSHSSLQASVTYQ